MTRPVLTKADARVGRNVVVMVLSFVGNYAASFATFPYLTRVLGPVHFGVLAYALAVAAYGALITEWGISLSGPRAVVACRNEPARLNALIWSVLGAKALLCIVATLLLAVLLASGFSGATDQAVLWISWSTVVANVCTMHWLFIGLERFKIISAMIFVSRAVTLPLTFWLVMTPGDVKTAAAIQAGGPMCAALLSVCVACRERLIRFPVATWRAVMARLTESADMFIATASVTLFGAANAIILTAYSGPYAAGIYAGADKIRTVCALVPAQLGTVLYPRIAHMFATRKCEAARLTVLGLAVITLASLAGAAMTIMFSEPITSVVLGARFHDAAPVLRVLALSTIFGNIGYFLGLQILVPSGASKLRTTVIFFSGCLNVVVAMLMVQRQGALGAAISFLICETLIFAAYAALIARSVRLRRYLLLGVRALKVGRSLRRSIRS